MPNLVLLIVLYIAILNKPSQLNFVTYNCLREGQTIARLDVRLMAVTIESIDNVPVLYL